MTTENKTLTTDQISFTDDEQFQYYLDHLLDDSEDESDASSEQTKQVTPEEKIKDGITVLEKSLEKSRAELRREFSVETFRQIQSESKQLDTLKQDLKYETELREKYRKLLGNTTDEDFSRLWETKLRDKVVMEDAREKEKAARTTSRHSLYRSL
jgi:hypothetical protein